MSDIIKLLPDSVANQIAAGEVIQRPASVIKELVENAVDAGATNITIVLKDAGRTLIQVVDNGKGMSPTDARMAFERHATSKIAHAEDLFSLHTMGFRGEALASICAIAQVDVRTMPAGETMGTRLLINGSKVESQTAEACVPGTNLMVKNLFYNVPARRKFLKKDSVELAAIMREFERMALVNTNVDFTLVHNDVTLHSLRRATMLKRIADLFGKSIDKQLIAVDTDTSIVRLSGYVGLPEHGRRRNPLQYLFVNGRNMRHPYFHKAIMQCYEALLPPDVQPNYFLDFTVDPATIDVNIHPTKNEIKFENEQAIWQILTAAVKESLGRYNVVPAIDFDSADIPDIPAFNPNADADHNVTLDPSYNPFTETGQQSQPMSGYPGGGGYMRRNVDDWEKLYDNFASKRDDAFGGLVSSKINMQPELDLDFDRVTPGVMQLKNRFILSPCREGVMIVDQQRAHERVLFDRYMKRIPGAEVQRVIFPDTLHLSPSQDVVMQAIVDELASWGFEVANTGQCEWSVNGLPTSVGESGARDMILAMIDSVAESGVLSGDEMRREMAMAMARTAAVKPGQPLGADEIDRLMSELMQLPAPGLSSDGRRTFFILSVEDIVKML